MTQRAVPDKLPRTWESEVGVKYYAVGATSRLASYVPSANIYPRSG